MAVNCSAAPYSAKTKHWFIYDGWLGDSWYSHGELDQNTSVPACPPPPQDPPSEDPLPMNGSGCPTCNSPLLLDLNRDGYHLTSPADGVLFDLDADGVAEQVAWTRVETDDAWLALDRNGNGRIDDGSELIGNRTPAYADNPAVTSANGFEALKFMEGPTYGRSVADGVINSRDGIFSRLLLWRDLNHNGISEPDELQRLSDSGLVAIQTDYKVAKRRDAFGNEFRQRAKGIWPDGEFFIYDVWLKRQD